VQAKATINLKGLKRQLDRFAGKAGQLTQFVVVPALLDTAPTIMKGLSDGAPRSTGRAERYRRKRGWMPLHSTIDVNRNSKGRYKTPDIVGIRIGPRYPDGAQAHLLEFGTKARFAFARDASGKKKFTYRRGGKFTYDRDIKKYRGQVQPMHWMEKAWSRMEAQVQQELEANYEKHMNAYIERHSRNLEQ